MSEEGGIFFLSFLLFFWEMMESVTIPFKKFLVVLHGMWDLSSPNRDWTCTPCTSIILVIQSIKHWTTGEVPKKWFLEMKSTPGEDAVKTVEMTTMDLEYCINLVDNIAAGFESTDSNSQRSATVGKTLSNSTTCNREIVCKELINGQTLLLFYFKKLQQPPLTSSNHHPDWSAASNTEARPSTSKKILIHWGSGDG